MGRQPPALLDQSFFLFRKVTSAMFYSRLVLRMCRISETGCSTSTSTATPLLREKSEVSFRRPQPRVAYSLTRQAKGELKVALMVLFWLLDQAVPRGHRL